jgi:Tfp pilus assembly protein PilX
MKQSNQKGFAAIEAVLVLVVLGILGFTGWFVWHAKQNTDKSLDAANSSKQAVAGKKAAEATIVSKADETASWLLYTPPGNMFSIRLADGWKLDQCTNSPLLTTKVHDNIALKQGTKAIVTDANCAGDSAGDGFSLSYVHGGSDAGGKTPTDTFATAAGDTVKHYTRVADSNLIGPGDLQNGGTYHSYLLTKDPDTKVTILYGVNLGQSDDHATIEKSLKTIIIK